MLMSFSEGRCNKLEVEGLAYVLHSTHALHRLVSEHNNDT